MSNQKLKKELKPKDLVAISLSNLIPLHISQEVQNKIEYLCQRINKVEWSGVLLYSVKGSIKDFDKVELIIEDIFPMDKGTAGSTGYELGDEIIDYRMNNPKSMNWKMGMVHSHHSMDAYFSGTDMSELSDNTEFHNYYLSLVVNNAGKMVAKVAFRGDIKGYECLDEQGKPWTLSLTNKKQAMFTFDCDIKSPRTLIKVPENFAKRTSEIIKESDKNRNTFMKNAKKFTPPNNAPKKLQQRFPSNHHNPFKEENEVWFKGVEDDDEMEQWNSTFSNPSQKRDKRSMSEDERYWDFTRFLLRFGEDLDGVDTVEYALEDFQVVVQNVNAYAGKVVTMYPALFEQYWDIFGEINTEVFFTTTGEVMDILENYNGLFDAVEPIVEGLNKMIEQMQKVEV